MADPAVALLDGARLASALAERVGLTVAATTRDDHVTVARRLGDHHPLVVGLATAPWPLHPDLHEVTAQAVTTYRGVVAWHALPRLLDALAAAAAPAVRTGAHVLVTAPDPGPDADPEELVFLREVAEGLAARTDLPSRSIAWRGTTRTPTALEALTSVVEAHGKRDVLELPVAPGTTADTSLQAAAEALGARLTTADLGRGTLVEVLTEVVGTVVAHEQATP